MRDDFQEHGDMKSVPGVLPEATEGWKTESFPYRLTSASDGRYAHLTHVFHLSRDSYQKRSECYDGVRKYELYDYSFGKWNECIVTCENSHAGLGGDSLEEVRFILGRSLRKGASDVITRMPLHRLLQRPRSRDVSWVSDPMGKLLKVSLEQQELPSKHRVDLFFTGTGEPQLLKYESDWNADGYIDRRRATFSYGPDSKQLPVESTIEYFYHGPHRMKPGEMQLVSRRTATDIQVETLNPKDDSWCRPDLSSSARVIDRCGGEPVVANSSFPWKWLLIVLGIFGLAMAFTQKLRESWATA